MHHWKSCHIILRCFKYLENVLRSYAIFSLCWIHSFASYDFRIEIQHCIKESSFNIRFLNTQKIFDFPIEENVFLGKRNTQNRKNYSRSKNVLQKKTSQHIICIHCLTVVILLNTTMEFRYSSLFHVEQLAYFIGIYWLNTWIK